MIDNIWVQAVGVVAMIFTICTFQMKNRKGILLCQLISCFIWATHYVLLGGYTGAILNICCAARSAVFYFKDSKRWASSPLWLVLFMALFAVCGAFTWEGTISLLPLIGTTLGTISVYLSRERNMRILYVINVPFWLAYNVVEGSIIGIICSSCEIVSVILSIIRYRKKDAEMYKTPYIAPTDAERIEHAAHKNGNGVKDEKIAC